MPSFETQTPNQFCLEKIESVQARIKMSSSSQKWSFAFLFYLLVLHFGLARGENITNVVEAIYVFGDSLADVGNNNHIKLTILKADFPHNGIDFPGGKATGRFCNGKNLADFIAEKVGLPTSPPYLKNINQAFPQGVSFASGGAGILNTTNDKDLSRAISLTRQVELFGTVVQTLGKQQNASGVQHHLSKSLFIIVIGSNDMFHYFGSDSKIANTTPQQYVDIMISTLQAQFKGLHKSGARKFLIIGLAPIGCCPTQRLRTKTGECNEDINLWAYKYNEQLKGLLNQLNSALGDIKYTYFDTYGALSNVMKEQSKYGFTSVDKACCGLGKLRAEFACTPISQYCHDRNEHIFWDLYHPTEKTSSILVDELYSGQEFVIPSNLQHVIKSF